MASSNSRKPNNVDDVAIWLVCALILIATFWSITPWLRSLSF